MYKITVSLIVGFLMFYISNEASATYCTPDISEGSHSKQTEEGYTSLECDISYCDNVTKVIYEINSGDGSTEWTPVFEGISKYEFMCLNSSDGYSLKNRFVYTAFLTKHILYIQPLLKQDQGKWRCIVYSFDYKEMPSKPLELYLTPTCQPIISEGSHSVLQLHGHASLECDISTCGHVIQVAYEKTSLSSPNKWIKVARGKTKQNYQALDTGTNGYSLSKRIEYAAFPTHHILYISILKEVDQGGWRCVAINQNKTPAQSQALNLGLVSPCKPTISEGSHSKLQLQGHTSLECDISTCGSVSKIIYEKKGIHFRTQWTAVYEGTNKTHSKYLDSGDDKYSLNPRVQYGAFQTHHILYISDLILKDQGQWRCVVTDINNKQAESNKFELKLEICSPEIVEGEGSHSEKGGALVLQCVLKACVNIANVVFEKADNNSSTDWTSLYKGIDDVHNGPTSTIDGYDLNRTGMEYSALSVSHILVINPLILKDQGNWRCKVYDYDGIGYESEELEVNIYVTPPKDNINIKPDNPSIVTDQTVNFTCTADGIHPEPIVIWNVYGRELNTGQQQNTKQADGMYTVINSINLSFNSIGREVISCEMRKDPKRFWIEKEITFNVKQSAKVLLPAFTSTVQMEKDDAFTLHCTGIGYHPNITWMHNKQPLRTDIFTIKQHCTNQRCESSLLSKRLTQTVPCSDVFVYKGEYVCMVSLGYPYQIHHIATSPILKLKGFASTIYKEKTLGKCYRNVDVRCDLCASGGSMIFWMFNEKRINHNKDAYFIDEIRSQHFGNYTKIVLNDQGNASCSVAVIHEESKDQLCIRKIALIVIFGGIVPTVIASVLIVLKLMGRLRIPNICKAHSSRGNSSPDTQSQVNQQPDSQSPGNTSHRNDKIPQYEPLLNQHNNDITDATDTAQNTQVEQES